MEPNLKFLSDEELLELYQSADVKSFEEFFRRHKRFVFAFLLSRLGNRSDAEDAFQRTFLKIHRYILSYDSKQHALAWVLTIAKNVAFDLKPKRPASLQLEDMPCTEDSLDTEAALEARSTLRTLLSGLAPRDRDLLEKRFFREDSFEEIANGAG